jgi:uncharacterized Zn-finger protein
MRKLTQEEIAIKYKDKLVQPVLPFIYLGINNKIPHICPFCQTIFNTTPYLVWSGHTNSCGCYQKKMASKAASNPTTILKRSLCLKIPKIGNSLLEKFPNIASEWHPTKNGNKTPKDVCYGSHDIAYWLCKNGHAYSTPIQRRTNAKSNCPYCSGKKVLKGFNDLLTIFPIIASEWSNKNTKGADCYISSSHTKVWWKCNICQHEWFASLNNRVGGTNCPKCNESKGEKRISEILDRNNIIYKREYRFINCRNKKPLSFDFFCLVIIYV